MGEQCPFSPTKGSRTAQSAAVDVEFRHRQARRLSENGQWEEAGKIYDSVTPMERQASHLAERGRGRSTYCREEILIPLKKESDAADKPGYPSIPRL